MAIRARIEPGIEGRLEGVVEGDLITTHACGVGALTTKVTGVKGNKLYFDVACHQGDVLVGSGIHKRAIVPADF